MKQNSQQDVLTQAEDAFICLAESIDKAFALVEFYIQRYEDDGHIRKDVIFNDLRQSVIMLAAGVSQLAEVLRRWKSGDSRLLSQLGTEVNIINELWINYSTTCNFLTSQGIDIDPTGVVVASTAFHRLVSANRLLT